MRQHIRRRIAFIFRNHPEDIRHLRAGIGRVQIQQKLFQVSGIHTSAHWRQIRPQLALHRPLVTPRTTQLLDQHPPLPCRIQTMPFMQQPRHDRLRLTKRLAKRESGDKQYMENLTYSLLPSNGEKLPSQAPASSVLRFQLHASAGSI